MRWATDGLAHDDTTVSALARHLGVDWHTLWNAIEAEATARVDRPERRTGVDTPGVDEHIWRPSRRDADRAVTATVDLTPDEHGHLHDVVQGRSGTVYAGWLTEQGEEFTAGVEHAALDPFRGYANAIPDELPDAYADRWHRGDQPAHRQDQTTGPRLSELPSLPATNPARPTAPGRTDNGRTMPRSEEPEELRQPDAQDLRPSSAAGPTPCRSGRA